MKISDELVQHVARLARLDLAPEAAAAFADQLGQILDYVEALDRVDTEGVAPTSHAARLVNALRDDTLRDHLSLEEALANAPEHDGDTFLVPRVIG